MSANPFRSRAREATFDAEALAEALRAHNMRYHAESPWEEASEQVKELWREKARWIIARMGRKGTE